VNENVVSEQQLALTRENSVESAVCE